MAVLKKTLFAENLEKYSVLIQDTDPNSKYFKITELPDTFTGGKNAFLIQGSEFLVADTIVKIEIKDSQGNIIYHEPGEGIPEYYEGTSKVISVYVYPDTAFGPCTITILGEVSEYEDTNGVLKPIPLQYKDTYNVRWQKEINVNPFLQNNTKIRFYRRPQVEISEILKPVFTIIETYDQQSGNANLIPINPTSGEHYIPWIASGQELNYQIKIAGGNIFTSNMLNQTMSFAEYPDYHPRIIEILSPTFAKLSEPLIEDGFVNQVISTPYAITYLSGSDKTQSEFTSSYAQIKLSQLETFAGDVKRVKVFRRSKGSISDFELVQDILLESTELLKTLEGTSKAIESTGIFNSNILSQFWNTDGTLTAALSNSRLINGVKLNGAGKFLYTSSLDLSARTVYELQFDAFYSASTASNLDIYISGSTNTNSSSLDEELIGTLEGITPTKKFENQLVQFSIPVNEPSASLYFSASQGEWHLSDLSLVVSQETAFSPDSVIFLTSVPTSIPNEIFEFKFEFYDVNNNFVPVSVLEEKQFSGGTNTIIVLTQIASSSAEISASLAAVSSSVSGTIVQVSSSVSGTIGGVSSSVSGSIFTLSGSVSGTIGSVSSSVSGTIGVLSGSVSGTIGVLSGSVSGSLFTLSSSVSTSISNVSSSISSSLSSANSQSLFTVFSASAYLDKFIFTDENGRLRRPPTASVAGLYTSDDHLGFFSESVWKTYMDSQGDFYLTSSAAGGGFLAWSSTQGRLQISGDINIQGGNAATNASLTSSLNAVSGTINSATQSLSTSVAATVFTTATGLIAKPPNVLVGSTSGLYLGSTFLGYYDGTGFKTFMADNGNFFLSGSGGDSLKWVGGVLSIAGAINITGGNAATNAALTSSLNAVSGAINSATSSLSSSLNNNIFTDTFGRINKPPITGSTSGLFLGSTNLGYYDGANWRTYMDNTGLFYLTGSANGNALLWDGNTLIIKGNISVGSSVPNSVVTGLGSLATQNTVSNTQVTGLGTLATQNTVSNTQVTGLGTLATRDTVASTHIDADAITATKIAADAVTAGKIAANAITSGKISAGAVIAGHIAANAVTADNIAAGAITTTKITAGAITADTIAAGAITTAKISAGAITADTIAAGAITAAKISAGSVETDKLKVGAIGGTTVTSSSIFIGTGTHNNTNTSFYVDNSGNFSLKDKLVWDGTTLSITGNITVSGGNAATTSDVSTVSTAAANAQSTANTAVSNAATAQATADTKITSGGAAADVNSNVTTISGGKIRTGVIESTGFSYLSGDFSTTGTQINLDNGLIRSKNFLIDSSGNAKFQGTITAESGSIGGWSISSNALTKTTGSFTLKLQSTSSGSGFVINESNNVDNFDRLRINADLNIPAISISDTGSLTYNNSGETLANIRADGGTTHIDNTYGPVLANDGSNNNGYSYGIIGLQYASEEIFVEAEQFPSISNVLSGEGSEDGIIEGEWNCFLKVQKFETPTDAQNDSNPDSDYGTKFVILAAAYYRQEGFEPATEYNTIFGGTIKANGGGGINTPGTAVWYRVEIGISYHLLATGGSPEGEGRIVAKRPNGNITVKYGRVGNGYSIFSPGGLQVYQGLKNYMNVADVTEKARGLDSAAASSVNFFEVKGKSSIIGALSISDGLTVPKGKNFKIQHPIIDNKWLYHTAIESPKADLIYRGNCELKDGFASCSIDSSSRMTEGTFAAFTKNPQLYLQNDSSFDRIKGNITSGSVKIYCENTQSTDIVSWLVVAERNDIEILNSPLYDKNGNYKTEKLKSDYVTERIKYLKNITSGSI